MDRIGRKQTMTLGFFLWGIIGFILGGALGPIQKIFPLFVVLYGIFNALGEMGPGVATFLCAAESFPTPLRGHYMGFAAAVGKAGAAIGTQVFTPIQDSFANTEKGQQGVFLIGSAFAIVGGLIAWFLIPDKERDLESEDVRFRRYLEANGYDLSCFGN
jgi:MFS family permease